MSANGYTLNPAIGDEDIEEVKAIQKGVREQIKSLKRKGLPIARYDFKLKKPYLEHPDGRREYTNE
jgi:hypothetical protein